MKLRSLLLVAALAGGCDKAKPTGNAGSDNAAPPPPPTANGDQAGKPGAMPAPKRMGASNMPAEPVPVEPPPTQPGPPSNVQVASGSADDVRAPTAADLAEYVKDIPGTGALQATFETNQGTIHCTLFSDQAPMTVANFVGLATGKKPWQDPKDGSTVKGKPFFDGLTFHRVIPGFMIQGGDPMGVGLGGPGYEFADEVVPALVFDKPGVLAMANKGSGSGTNGSQFFITEQPVPRLNGGYSIFGQCKEVDVVKKIARVPVGANDRPNEAVIMTSVKITHASK
jgi:peptidyl-prolyl cis-trans isomerase A (cyclophilin A)